MAIDTTKLIRTCDPYVYAEALRRGYARYVDVKSGRRWEVFGVCQNIGKCWEGAIGPRPSLDCPVTPEFANDGCCQFTYNELPPAQV